MHLEDYIIKDVQGHKILVVIGIKVVGAHPERVGDPANIENVVEGLDIPAIVEEMSNDPCAVQQLAQELGKNPELAIRVRESIASEQLLKKRKLNKNNITAASGESSTKALSPAPVCRPTPNE